jgi:beta-glucanase (GH16 family)
MYTKASLLSALSLAVLPRLATANNPPTYSGYTSEWYANFVGDEGTLPSTDLWDIRTGNLGVNDELEVYTSSKANLQRSGNGTLQIIPVKDSSGSWTSGRIESTYTFTPTHDAKTMVESRIRFGNNTQTQKQGMWPAFWMLGESFRQTTLWPECGELDVMEMVDGALTGYGTVHCDISPGGICDETNGIGEHISVSDYNWHKWRLVWDNTPGTSNWEKQTITWYLDGTQFHQISGSEIGNHTVWISLAHSPMYFILNLAVGGDWVSVGPPCVK